MDGFFHVIFNLQVNIFFLGFVMPMQAKRKQQLRNSIKCIHTYMYMAGRNLTVVIWNTLPIRETGFS